MTSSRENERPASFDGVPFIVTEITTKEGVKRAKYLYLNSTRRTQKPMGGLPPVFTVRGHTYGATGDTYEKARDRLRAALQNEDDKVFVDPWSGPHNCTADEYEFRQSTRESNRCNFTITFSKITDKGASPKQTINNAANLSANAVVANRAMQDAFGKSIQDFNTDAFDQNVAFFNSVGDLLPAAFSGIADTLEQAAAFALKSLQLKEQAEFYANNPSVGAAAIMDSLLGVDGLTSDVMAIFEAYKVALFGWPGALDDGNGEIYLSSNPTSDSGAQAYLNVQTQQTLIQGLAMNEACKHAGNIDYNSALEIENVKADIDAHFLNMTERLTVEPNFAFDFDSVVQPDFYDSYFEMRRMRIDLFQILDAQKNAVRKTRLINAPFMPVSVIAYRLYKDSSRSKEIMDLNGLFDNMWVGGQLYVYDD